MATYQPPPPKPPRPTHHPQPAMAALNVPSGTFSPGTKVQCGSHRVIIDKYLSEGGFAHVYVVSLTGSTPGKAVLKRVAVPDKETLGNMRTEVETMKKLQGHKHIVTYIDSHASQLKGGGYEVFLLMEYCAGGGLIDFMNTRLQNRLKEPEILEIFSDAAEGVACMHYLKPPLLHRDLKVENILISKTTSERIYKLCDFGSTAPPRPAATSAAEGRLIEDDVQKHTTLQYRSPEMIDVYRKRPIDEKSDIWALGVLLYKLCYYTTPFEEQGQMAILSASFKFHSYPPFSDRLKLLIASLLAEDPKQRPNIYQVVKEVCSMRGRRCPISDIYARRTHSEVRSNQRLPSLEPNEPNVVSSQIGASLAPPDIHQQQIPDIKPMRRGRPQSQTQQGSTTSKTPSPAKKAGGDPFAALDSSNYETRAAAADELAGRFPSLDEFSILQKKDDKFPFGDSSQPPNLKSRVTDALADDAFAQSSAANGSAMPQAGMAPAVAKAASLKKSQPLPIAASVQRKATEHVPIQQPEPKRPPMVSTGTMTSRPSSPQLQPHPRPSPSPRPSDRPVWKVPQDMDAPRRSTMAKFDSLASSSPTLRSLSKSPLPSQPDVLAPKSPASSRPSLEGARPSLDIPDTVHRSRSANHKGSRSNKADGPESALPPRHDSLRRDDSLKRRSLLDEEPLIDIGFPSQEANITSDVDYLRAMEEQDAAKGHRRSSSLRHLKHASMPGMYMHGKKNILSGRFGDTFKRFEAGRHSPRPPRSDSLPGGDNEASPLADLQDFEPSKFDEEPIDETEDLPPEVRRELERRRLSQEERRVAEAAAAYRERVAANAGGASNPNTNRAMAIQNRVKSLLEESEKTSPVKKTAEGYGHFTEAPDQESLEITSQQSRPTRDTSQPLRPDKTVSVDGVQPTMRTSSQIRTRESPYNQHLPAPPSAKVSSTQPVKTLSTASAVMEKPHSLRPSAPPKPLALRTGGPAVLGTPSPTINATSRSQTEPPEKHTASPNLIDLGKDSPDVEATFAKRYPNISLEMVETEIIKADGRKTSNLSPVAPASDQRVDAGGRDLSSVSAQTARPGPRIREV